MSARALRRRFATPFVLTLAAVPAACVTSNPPPPSQPQQAQHEHGDGHVNPPKPAQAPEPAEWHTGNNAGTNDHVKGTASTTSATVAQEPVAQTQPSPGPGKQRGYRQWTVTRSGTKCESMVKVSCPEGAMCNPPPPAKYACPKDLADNSRLDIIQHADKGDCFVDFGEVTCPPNASCNPPRPQKVACPK